LQGAEAREMKEAQSPTIYYYYLLL
jgi:hypothetical protein